MLINIYSTDFFRLTCWPTYNLPQGLEGSSKHSSSCSVPDAGVSEHSIQLPAEIHRCSAGKISTAQWTVPFYISLRHCLWMIQGDPAAIFLYISKALISLIANLANSKLDTNLSTQQLISVCVQSSSPPFKNYFYLYNYKVFIPVLLLLPFSACLFYTINILPAFYFYFPQSIITNNNWLISLTMLLYH